MTEVLNHDPTGLEDYLSQRFSNSLHLLNDSLPAESRPIDLFEAAGLSVAMKEVTVSHLHKGHVPVRWAVNPLSNELVFVPMFSPGSLLRYWIENDVFSPEEAVEQLENSYYAHIEEHGLMAVPAEMLLDIFESQNK